MGVQPGATVKALQPVKPKILELPDLDQRIVKIQEQVNKTVEGANLMRMISSEIKPHPAISSGSLSIDVALGIGGYPQGRIVEVYGPYSSGKTTLTLHAIANAQKNGGLAAFIDAEHALDLKYARALNVNVEQLLVSQPDSGDQALDIAKALVQEGMFKYGDIIVVDSVAALVTKRELEGDTGDAHVGETARLMSQAMKMLVGAVSKTGALLFFTNQIRDAVNMSGYGPATTTVGGNALKFYASVRLETKRVGSLDKNVDGKATHVANKTQVTVQKNKMAPPFAQVEIIIRFGEGVSRLDELLILGQKYKSVVLSGSFYKMAPIDKPRPDPLPPATDPWWFSIGQGLENALSFLRANPSHAEFLENDIRGGLGLLNP
jgi:recombination protein RecA